MSLSFEKTESTEIKPVTKLMRDDGEFLLKCPHCGRIRGINDDFEDGEEVYGEQYQDNLCDGWYEISHNAVMVNDVEDL